MKKIEVKLEEMVKMFELVNCLDGLTVGIS